MLPGYKDRPKPVEPPRPALPCPFCNARLDVLPDDDCEKLGLPPDDVTIYGCGACQKMAAHVEWIADAWRVCRVPEDMDVVIADAWDGLRQRHMLTSDSMDPMWSGW